MNITLNKIKVRDLFSCAKNNVKYNEERIKIM